MLADVAVGDKTLNHRLMGKEDHQQGRKCKNEVADFRTAGSVLLDKEVALNLEFAVLSIAGDCQLYQRILVGHQSHILGFGDPNSTVDRTLVVISNTQVIKNSKSAGIYDSSLIPPGDILGGNKVDVSSFFVECSITKVYLKMGLIDILVNQENSRKGYFLFSLPGIFFELFAELRLDSSKLFPLGGSQLLEVDHPLKEDSACHRLGVDRFELLGLGLESTD